MERQPTMSATQDPVWLDGFNNWVCFNSYGLLWSFTTSPDQECPQSSNARWVLPLSRSATRRPRIQTGTKSQRIAAMSPSGMNRCGGYLKKSRKSKQIFTLVINKTFTQVTWSSCTQSDQPSSSGTYYHMEVTFWKSYPVFFPKGSSINYVITFWGPERPPPPLM